jgi:beta-lactam-binding protein with PASTA domain
MLARAKTILITRKCALGRVTRVFHSTVRKGRIVKHRPLAGRTFAAGTKVNVVVSRGKRS